MGNLVIPCLQVYLSFINAYLSSVFIVFAWLSLPHFIPICNSFFHLISTVNVFQECSMNSQILRTQKCLGGNCLWLLWKLLGITSWIFNLVTVIIFTNFILESETEVFPTNCITDSLSLVPNLIVILKCLKALWA